MIEYATQSGELLETFRTQQVEQGFRLIGQTSIPMKLNNAWGQDRKSVV